MLLLLKVLLVLAPVSAVADSNKGEALNYLRAVLKQNYTRLSEVDQTTQKMLSTAKPENEETRLTQLNEERKELVLRQDFLDRLIFRLDSNFRGGDLQQFFSVQLKEMTFLEATSAESNNNKLWKFLSYLTTAVQEIPERNEDMASFIEGYMNFSSIIDPKSPKEFMKTRQYTNGKTSVAAQSTPRDQVGEVVEQRLKQLKSETLKIRTNVK